MDEWPAHGVQDHLVWFCCHLLHLHIISYREEKVGKDFMPGPRFDIPHFWSCFTLIAQSPGPNHNSSWEIKIFEENERDTESGTLLTLTLLSMKVYAFCPQMSVLTCEWIGLSRILAHSSYYSYLAFRNGATDIMELKSSQHHGHRCQEMLQWLL